MSTDASTLILFPELQADAAGYWSGAWRRLKRNRLAVGALILISVGVLLALLAPLVATHDPSAQDLRNTFASPSFDHLMGTDNLGRDWFSRVVYGARLSMAIGLVTQVVVLGIGLPLGLLAGYSGRAVDSLLMRLTDFVYAFPDLLLVILLRAVLGGSLLNLFLIIGLITWVDLARLVRGQALSLRQREFVSAARSLGASDFRIITRHILPSTIGPVIVMVAFGVPRAIFIEASLSFIGLGISTGTPSWGTMVQEGYSAIFSFPHLVLFPSIAIAVVMLSFTFLGDGLRDALDPQSTSASRTTGTGLPLRRRKKAPEQPTMAETPRAA